MDDSELLHKKLEEQQKRFIKKGYLTNYYDEILPNLYLGDLKKALDEKENFDIIINLSEFEYKSSTMIHYFNIPDTPDADIIYVLDNCIPIITEGLQNNKKILVHCLMGRSRSASIIIGYLMKTNNWTLEQSIAFINSKRQKPIEPNIGFIYKLKLWAKYVLN